MEKFGRFELLKRLGAGGMGEVFLAQSPDFEQPVVLKRILPHLTENERFLRLFLDETRIAARLNHPTIARIYELGEVAGTWFVAMEYVPGKDLREILKRSRQQESAVPVSAAVFIGREIASALAYAHALKDSAGKNLDVVHRDVSPHNILLSTTGAVKLIDFGVALAANKTVHTAAGILKGKFPYMSPEQANARPVDVRTDVFALGIVLWEAIAGALLFRGKSDAATLKKVRACQVPPLSDFVTGIPRSVDKVLRKALQKDPQDRFRSAAAMAEALDDALAGLDTPDIPALLEQFADVPGLDDDEVDSGPAANDSATEAEGSADDSTYDEAPSQPSLHVRLRPRPSAPGGPGSSESSISRTRKLLSELAQRPTNLSAQATSFVGRVAELADLQQLFHQGPRLISLLGPGGTGKTRLAIQFASQLVSHYRPGQGGVRRGGVWFVELADARDVDGICARIAIALSVPLSPGNPVVQLAHVLAARGEVMLVLDNVEQVLAHAPATLQVWLRAAPRLRVVATSRELLRLPGEVVFEVPPLRVPEKGNEVRSSEAAQLFVERSRTVRPDWEPTAADEAAIAEVVSQLDGMPLAIELAAARMAVLNPAQLVQRLPRRFELLGGSARGASERQATLRGTIDWSWQMLTPAEASTLAQCAVFRGGFTAEAAEAVVDLSGVSGTSGVLETLLTLRTKSLVRSYSPRGDDDQMRYGLYESIREYALEKLLASSDDPLARERHARYFLALGARLSTGAEGSAELLDALELERDNLYAVYQRAVESGHTGPRALQAALALDPLLTLRGPFGHHLLMLDSALERLGPDPRRRASALEARGRARQARGKTAEAFDDYLALLELARRLKDRALEGRAESYLGAIERVRGQRGEARLHFDRALTLLRRVKDRRMEGRTLSGLAVLQHEMGLEQDATSSYLLALEIHRAAADRRYEGITLANIGVLQQAQGLLGQARANYQQALAIHRELGNRRSEGISHINLGDLNRDLEQAGVAANHYQSALAILKEVGARRFEGIALVSLGSLHQEQGQHPEAAARYYEGLKVLAEVDDRRYGGLAMAALAGLDALEGRLTQAEAGMMTAVELLSDSADASFLDALDLYRAHVDLGTATLHPSQELEDRIAARIDHAERAGPPGPRHPAGAPSPADRSEHVRAALRSLKTALKARR